MLRITLRRTLAPVAYLLLCTTAAPADAPAHSLKPLVNVLLAADDAAVQRDVLQGMIDALQGRRLKAPDGWERVKEKLGASANAEVREKTLLLSVMFGDPDATAALRAKVGDARADGPARQAALQTLVEAKAPDLPPLLRGLLADPAMRGAALRALGSFGDPEAPAAILGRYKDYTEADKADAVATLASRPAYAEALLDAMERGAVPTRDLSAFTARQLLTFNDKALADRLAKVWGVIRPAGGDKKLLARYQALTPPDALKKADRSRGRAVFARTCAKCHTLFGEGGKIGPDLTGSQRVNPEYVLTKVLDPSAVVAKDYQMTVFTLADGRVVNGIAKADDGKVVTVQTQNDVLRLNKADIESRKASAQSMMPDGQLAMMTDPEVRDLIAYLAGSDQPPLPADAPKP